MGIFPFPFTRQKKSQYSVQESWMAEREFPEMKDRVSADCLRNESKVIFEPPLVTPADEPEWIYEHLNPIPIRFPK